MFSQSRAERSAANTTIPRDCEKSSVAGSNQNGKRKDGADWVLGHAPLSAISSAAMRSSISSFARSNKTFEIIGCDQLWCAIVWPTAAMRRTSSGNRAEDLPTRKNVARTHSRASAASTFCVLSGRGPSSKVRTTSWSTRGTVSEKLFNLPANGPSNRQRARATCRARAAAGSRPRLSL